MAIEADRYKFGRQSGVLNKQQSFIACCATVLSYRISLPLVYCVKHIIDEHNIIESRQVHTPGVFLQKFSSVRVKS